MLLSFRSKLSLWSIVLLTKEIDFSSKKIQHWFFRKNFLFDWITWKFQNNLSPKNLLIFYTFLLSVRFLTSSKYYSLELNKKSSSNNMIVTWTIYYCFTMSTPYLRSFLFLQFHQYLILLIFISVILQSFYFKWIGK